MPAKHKADRLTLELRLKRWYNQKWPYYRRCGHRWCWRYMNWDHRCYKHQDDE